MGNPGNVETVFEIDEAGTGYYVYERTGGINVRPPSHISMRQYLDWRKNNTIRDHWRERSTGNNTISANNPLDFKFATNSDALKDIFGGGSVEIRPNGTALLDIGGEFNRSQNPSLPIRQQRTGNLKFDQQIQLNVVGKIGEKLRLNASWDTQATFDFENQLKLEYTGTPNEILQKIEAGNVSLPLNGSLISGGQNLFGIKTALKFGPLMVTTIASQQKGKTQAVTATGGAQVTEFRKRGDDYDYNRHFFLSHYFRSRYEFALKGRPNINSPVTITRIEVWITNNNSSSTIDNRNAVGFVDLGETETAPNGVYPTQKGVVWNDNIVQNNSFPDNNANNIYSQISASAVYSEKTTVDDALETNLFFKNGTDFTKVENMRKLNPNEFTFHPQLGYVTLNSALQQNQVLFVSYEYRLGAKVYQVGDFTQDPGKQANSLNSNVLFLKMLKPDKIQPRANNQPFPTWDLMMKNIYSIGGYGLTRDNFRLEVIYDSRSQAGDIGYLPTGAVKNVPLIQVFGLDTLQNNSQAGPDNFFDYIDRITILPDKGMIIFPVLEPFGDHLRNKLKNVLEDVDKYVFDTLYAGTPQDAINFATDKNRYFIKGSYQGTSGAEISLNSINVAPGSVKVTANGITLVEGTDYNVDYTIGKVTVLNQGILTSGQELKVTFETNSLFGIDTKTMVGSRLDYTISKDFQLGATVLHMNEKPLTNKIVIGDEPTANTIWGLDGIFRRDSKFLTRLVDKLPFLQTNEISTVQAQGEFAQLLPGHPRAIEVNGEKGIAYLDDFESAKTTFDLMGFRSWFIASFPGDNGNNGMFTPAPGWNATLSPGFSRGKLAWYGIDPSFYYGSTDEEFPEADLSNHYTRQITPKEVFPNQTRITGDNLLRTFDLHFQPSVRGLHNYEVDPSRVKPDGTFLHPEDMWAGIQRKTSGNTDFEAANFEFIEFWMLDPFIYDSTSNKGEFFLNLGAVSEDVLPDNVREFENGLPGDLADSATVGTTDWARYPLTTPPTTSFSNEPNERPNQDVGLDGLSDAQERIFFKDYLDQLNQIFGSAAPVVTNANNDPTGDNYSYFRGTNLNGQGVLQRYLPMNGTEGNTPINSNQNGYSTQGSPNPDTEDLNQNSTLNTSERYWEYKMNFSRNDMRVGKNYIVDVIPAEVNLVNNKTETVNWYQFRIPLVSGKSIGDISDFKAIEFIRMYMKGWDKETVLRFAKFQLVSTTWRTSRDYMGVESDTLIPDPQPGSFFNIGTLNIEENGSRQPFPYVLPPGIRRQQQIASTQAGLLQNEQALIFKTCGLADGDGRGAFKLVNYDMRSYKRLKMWVHAENIPGSGAQEFQDGELRAFIRLGSDIKNNYYEYEIPLKQSLPGATDSTGIWNNQFDVELAQLAVAKALRNEAGWPTNNRYAFDVPPDGDRVGHRIYVVGTPKTSEVKAMMIGIRNENDAQGPLCAEVWVNELRMVDFDETSGWASNARATIKLADFANITVSGSIRTPGFGALEQKINNRSRETTRSFDVAGNFNMGKFFPKNWGIQLPLYLSYGERVVDPKFNPLEADVQMVNYLQAFENQADQDSIQNSLQDHRINKSISLNNIRKVRIQQPGNSKTPPKTHPWDIENFTLSLSYNETFSSNYTTLARWQKNHKAALGYAYNFNSKPIEPFKNAKHKNPITLFNFNPLPKTIGFNLTLDRQYEENQIRQSTGLVPLAPTYMKRFMLNRNYTLRWDFTKSLSFNYTATNAGRVDEPIGATTRANRSEIYDRILNFGVIQDPYGRDSLGRDKAVNLGRNMTFSQQVGLNYIVPFDKFKPTSWINATLGYQGGYNWLTAPDNNLSLGNQINNSNNITANTRLNLENLYNKVGFLKKMLDEQKAGPTPPPKPVGPQVSGKPLPKPTPKPGEEEADTTKEERFVVLKAIGKQVVKTLLSVRNVDLNYSTNSATSVSGWMPNSDNFGNDFRYQYLNEDSTQTIQNNRMAPGLPFVIGWQPEAWRASQVGNPAMLDGFAQNGWISTNSTLSTPFTQTWGQQFTGRTSITPFRDFKVDINVTKNNSVNYSELYHYDDTLRMHLHDNQLFTGQYSVSYIFLGTSFEKNVDLSKTYIELQNNARGVISERLASANPEYATFLSRAAAGTTVVDGYQQGYYRNSQEVLIPSFLAAYGVGKSKTIGLTAFPAIPLPNWNVNYNGLGKIPALKKHFTSISIKHAYRGTYTVGGYTSNVRFTGDDLSGYTSNFFGIGVSTANPTDSVFNIQSQFIVPQVSFNESFAPLAGINLNFKNGLTAGLDLKMNRMVSLSLGNQQLTETRSKDFSLSVSYRKDKLEKTLQLFGRTVNLKNALNSRLEVSLRDNKTRNRKLDFQGNSDFTAGNFMLIVKPSIDYVINQKLNVRFYIEHTRNRPAISTSFPSSYTAFGFQVRFTL